MDTVHKERRRNVRYKMNKNVLSISQDILAEVLDISYCGMGCKCLTNSEKPLGPITEIELLNCELGTSIEGLPCSLVRSREKTISEVFTSTKIVNFGLEFTRIDEHQRKLLVLFIKENTVHEASAFL